jgi:hypothetical protein
MGGNRNKRGGRELSSAHPYGGMGTGRPYRLNLRTRITTTTSIKINALLNIPLNKAVLPTHAQKLDYAHGLL